MTPRETAIWNIAVGDIFHATTPNNASLICLALKVGDTTISAQTIGSFYELEFDRRSGIVEHDFQGEIVRCVMDSVALLPTHVRDALMGLYDERPSEQRKENKGLTQSEWQALAFASRYYPANLLPPPGEAWETLGIDFSRAPKGDPDDFESPTRTELQNLILINFLIPRNQWQELGPSPPSAGARSG